MIRMKFLYEKKPIFAREVLLFLAWLLFLVSSMYSASLFSRLLSVNSKFIYICIVGLLFLNILIEDKADHIILYMVFAGVFMMTAFMSSGIRDLSLIFLFIYAARNADQDKMIEISFITILFMLIITITAYFMGVFENVDQEYLYARGSQTRMSLGFGYVTTGANLFLSLVFCWLYIKKNTIFSALIYLLLFVINFFIFKATDTRAVFLIVLGLLALTYFIKDRKYEFLNKKEIKVLLVLFYPFCALIIFLLAYNYNENSPFLVRLNKVLSNRLSLGRKAFDMYSVNPFGNIVKMVSFEEEHRGQGSYFYIDSSYLQILFMYGWVILLVVFLFFGMILCYEARNGNLMRVIVLLAIGVHAITDPQLFWLMYTPFILYIGKAVKEKNKKHSEFQWYIRNPFIQYKRIRRG